MATFKCPDCKNVVSTEADACPKCGRKVTQVDIQNGGKKKPSKIIYIIAALAVLGLMGVLAGDKSENKTPNKGSATAPETTTDQNIPAKESEKYLAAWSHIANGNQKDGFTALEKAANEGDSDSIAALGICYLKGIGTKTEIKKGLELLRRGADNGSHFGCANLGFVYLYGKFGVPKNVDRGVEYLKKAMKMNSPTGYLYMGNAYYDGSLGTKDPDKALVMYEKAALLGNKEAESYARDLKNPPDFKVSAPDLVAEYEANEVAADKKYKGKIVRITGKIGDIKKTGIGDEMYIRFKMPNPYAIRSVSCTFGEEAADELATLQQGDRIVIQGTVSQLFMDVQIENCWIFE